VSPEKPQARYAMTYAHNRFGLYVSGGRGPYSQSHNDHRIYSDLWFYEFR
jgi:hypothetical protein